MGSIGITDSKEEVEWEESVHPVMPHWMGRSVKGWGGSDVPGRKIGKSRLGMVWEDIYNKPLIPLGYCLGKRCGCSKADYSDF